jgi:hypothetical protein
VIVELNSEFEEFIQKGLCQGFESSREQCDKNGGGKAGILKSGSLMEESFFGIGSCTFSVSVGLGRGIHCRVGSDI